MFCAEQVGRGGDRDAVAHALGELQRPAQRLHAAQAATDHRGEPLDAEAVQQARLGQHPVLDGDHREVGPVGLAGGRIDVHGAGRPEARAQVVDADDEELVGIERLARSDQVVPPAFAFRHARVGAGDVVRGIEGVAHQHRVAAVGVERAVGLVDQGVVAQARTAAQRQRLVEVHRLGCDVADGCHDCKTKPGATEGEAGFCLPPFSCIC